MDMTFILYSIGVFLVIVLVLVIILLVAKKYLCPSGNVTITINGKDKLEVEQGSNLLSTLADDVTGVCHVQCHHRRCLVRPAGRRRQRGRHFLTVPDAARLCALSGLKPGT